MDRHEFEIRLKRFGQRLADQGIDVGIVTPGTDMEYLCGVRTHRSERFIGLLVADGATPVIVCPSFEKDRMAGMTPVAGIVGWDETVNPFEVVSDVIRSFHGGSKAHSVHVGLCATANYWEVEGLTSVMPGARLSGIGGALSGLRLIKSPVEIALLEQAARLTASGCDRVLARPWEGEDNLEAEFNRIARSQGADQVETLIQAGEWTAVPHSSPPPVVSAKGVVLIDACASVEGYYGDITRTVFFGEESGRSEFEHIRGIVARAQEAAIAAVRPGVEAQEVDRAARRVISEAGYGEFFTHRTGHGLGLDIHEPPYLVEGNTITLEPGMVFTVEPGIYLPGKFGVRIEDNVAVTEEGARVISC